MIADVSGFHTAAETSAVELMLFDNTNVHFPSTEYISKLSKIQNQNKFIDPIDPPVSVTV